MWRGLGAEQLIRFQVTSTRDIVGVRVSRGGWGLGRKEREDVFLKIMRVGGVFTVRF